MADNSSSLSLLTVLKPGGSSHIGAESKPAKTIDQMIALMSERGLVITDEAELRQVLFDCNYYRLSAYRNFCGALDWFSLSVGGVGVSRGGVEFVPVDAGPVCGRDAVVRFGRRCLFALPQGVGDE